MRIVADFMPSSVSSVECVVNNDEKVVIGRSSASVADYGNDPEAKQITCAAFGTAPTIPERVCE